MTGRPNGFTLVEVVVALLIFAMLAAAGVSLLSLTVKAQASSVRLLTNVSGERRLSALLVNDLGQAVPRVSRDVDGRPRPAFQANQGRLLFAFVRGGDKPQHVEIRLEQDALVRVATPFVDGALPGKPLVLETGIRRAKLRFRKRADWQDDWSSEKTDAMPRALELMLEQRDGRAITRKFIVGAGE